MDMLLAAQAPIPLLIAKPTTFLPRDLLELARRHDPRLRALRWVIGPHVLIFHEGNRVESRSAVRGWSERKLVLDATHGERDCCRLVSLVRRRRLKELRVCVLLEEHERLTCG